MQLGKIKERRDGMDGVGVQRKGSKGGLDKGKGTKAASGPGVPFSSSATLILGTWNQRKSPRRKSVSPPPFPLPLPSLKISLDNPPPSSLLTILM